MNPSLNRRDFLKKTSVLTVGAALLTAAPRLRAASPNERVRLGIIGCTNRGMNHITACLAVPNVEIAYICDVDRRAVDKGIAAVVNAQRKQPRGIADLRQMLDDPELDAVTIAMPDHWHTPATMLACAAGKHVYVEKPGSHNLRESEWIVAAARKYKRVVQMGNQRRSWTWVIEAMAALHAGEIGKVSFARGWYTNNRASIGRGKVVPTPEWLDYSLWQGPAPEQTFRDNILHYNWHWFWNWGTGELGNNAVHALDIARWGLRVDLPKRITCGGNRYFHQDDWETPDTTLATFDFGDVGIVWEGQSCAPRGFEDSAFGVSFYGDKGCTVVRNTSATIYDLKNQVVREIAGEKNLFAFDALHFGNFMDGIREGKPLRADIEEGQKSTALCHLANIAWRTGHTINFDPASRKIIGDRQASALVGRKYRRGWEPRV